ncbi:MAG: Bax inhibitor-1 family protein [Dehalococcoidia bacterium]
MNPDARGENPNLLGASTTAPVAGRGAVATVFGLLAFSFVFSAVGGVVGIMLMSSGVFGLPFFIILAIAQIGFIIALRPAANASPALGLLVLYGFTFLSGLSLGPIIGMYAVAAPAILGQALLLTAIITGGLTIFAWTTEISLARFSTWMFVGLLALIGGSILAIFVRATWLEILLGGGGAVLFSLYLIHDVQKIKQMPNAFSNVVMMTAMVYLDIVNIFLSLLRLLSALSGNSRD